MVEKKYEHIAGQEDKMSISEVPSTTNTEITERKNILAMMEKLLHWAAIIESSDDAIISKSMEGKITSWNKGARDLYGYTEEEVLGKPVSILMPSGKEDDFSKIMNQLKAGKKVDHYETKRKAKDGTIIDVSITVSPIKDASGNIIGASKIARDITERVEYEKRRDNFISMVSHELKTPITSQKIFVDLLEKEIQKNDDEQYHSYIKKISSQTEKLNELVNDLLELSRLQTGRLKLENNKFDMDALIAEIISDIKGTTGHEIVHKNKGEKQVMGDSDRIGQVVLNMLTNAIKYAPGETDIVVTSAIEDDMVRVSVQDFGMGIAEEYHNKIFERFFRVMGDDESTYPGMGIGLNFCREIIERHGGDMWVESEKGEGATFIFSFPINGQKNNK